MLATVQKFVDPETAGDPMTGQKWVRSSLRSLCDRLDAVGHPVSPPTVGRMLKGLGYSLRVNSKKIEANAGVSAAGGRPQTTRHAPSIALQPVLLLLDEPTSGISVDEKFGVVDTLIRVVRETRTTTVFVENDMHVVAWTA